jgi:hypothetical protein
MMTENEKRLDTASGSEPLNEESPADKLETEAPISSPTPGIENADREELKDETSPNTE